MKERGRTSSRDPISNPYRDEKWFETENKVQQERQRCVRIFVKAINETCKYSNVNVDAILIQALREMEGT